MSNALKILVVDDSELQREAAKAQLSDHDLTVVNDFISAAKLLDPQWPDSTFKPEFDVVLTDMLMPGGGHGLSREAKEKYANQMMPMGIFIAMIAAMTGVKLVAIVSDMGGHDHPLAVGFQRQPRGGDDDRLHINSIPVMGGGCSSLVRMRKDDLRTYVDYLERDTIPNVEVKDWRRTLDWILHPDWLRCRPAISAT